MWVGSEGDSLTNFRAFEQGAGIYCNILWLQMNYQVPFFLFVLFLAHSLPSWLDAGRHHFQLFSSNLCTTHPIPCSAVKAPSLYSSKADPHPVRPGRYPCPAAETLKSSPPPHHSWQVPSASIDISSNWLPPRGWTGTSVAARPYSQMHWGSVPHTSMPIATVV